MHFRDEFQPLDNSYYRTENLTSAEKTASAEEVSEQTIKKYGRKRVSKALQLLLNVFAQFSSAKSVYRESEILEIYEDVC